MSPRHSDREQRSRINPRNAALALLAAAAVAAGVTASQGGGGDSPPRPADTTTEVLPPDHNSDRIVDNFLLPDSEKPDGSSTVPVAPNLPEEPAPPAKTPPIE